MNIKFEKVTKDNLELAVSIQNRIFSDEDGRQNYIEGINNETIIFSKSLTKKKTELWNNKFLQLTAQAEKEK